MILPITTANIWWALIWCGWMVILWISAEQCTITGQLFFLSLKDWKLFCTVKISFWRQRRIHASGIQLICMQIALDGNKSLAQGSLAVCCLHSWMRRACRTVHVEADWSWLPGSQALHGSRRFCSSPDSDKLLGRVVNSPWHWLARKPANVLICTHQVPPFHWSASAARHMWPLTLDRPCLPKTGSRACHLIVAYWFCAQNLLCDWQVPSVVK